jgi:hypothetical protein
MVAILRIDAWRGGNTILGIVRLNPQNIFGAILYVAAGVSIGLSIGSDAHLRYLAPQTQAKINAFVRLDRVLYVDGRGVFLRFNGYDAQHIGYAARFYYRAVYDLYPRTVLLADPSVVVSNADDVRNADAPPGPSWLAAHGIDRLMTVHYEPNVFQFSAELSKVN